MEREHRQQGLPRLKYRPLMASIPCPHCQAKTFTWWDKYRSGKWLLLNCPECGGRACAQPIVLGALYFLYVWDVMLFGYLAYLDSLWYLAVMVTGWLILDYFALYVPLAPLRAKKGSSSHNPPKENE